MTHVEEQLAGEENSDKTKVVSIRIPKFVDKQIEALVNLGMFSSKNDFINYAIQKTLFELLAVRVPTSDEDLIDMIDLKPSSPPSEEEIQEVLNEIEREVQAKFSETKPERRRVLHVRKPKGNEEDKD